MSGWFRPKCPVDEPTKLWIERRMAWLTHEFGWERILNAPVVLPNDTFFPDPYDGTGNAARLLLKRLCGYMHVDPAPYELELYTERAAVVHEESRALGSYADQEDKTTVWLDASTLPAPVIVTATLVHELAYDYLLGRRLPDARENVPASNEDELLADLLTVFLGLGVLTANSTVRSRTSFYGLRRRRYTVGGGYLSSPMFGYALALFAWVRGEAKPRWRKSLKLDVRARLRRGMAFLGRTGDSTYTRLDPLHPEVLSPCPPARGTPESADDRPRHGKARTRPKHAAATRARTADGFFTGGCLAAANGDYAAAVDRFSEAIRRSPNDSEAYQQRCLAYCEAGRYVEGLADGQQAVQLAPEEMDSYRARGRAFFGLGQYALAVDDFGHVVEKEKWDGRAYHRWNAYYWRGRAVAKQGDLQRAAADLSEAAFFATQRAEIYVERSRIYEQLGHYDKALQDRREAFRLDPELAEDELGQIEIDAP